MGRTLKQQIRKVIRQHYGEHLASFRDDVCYRDGTESFVSGLSRVLKGEIEYERDWTCDLAKYSRGGSLDREIGKRLKVVRLQKGVSLEELAERTGFNQGYLDALENGDIVTFFEPIGDALKALKATRKDKVFVINAMSVTIPLKEGIHDVIKLHYGKSLWYFHPNVKYEQSVEPFVQSLVALVERPFTPPFGYKVVSVDGERKVIPDPATAPIVRAAFEKELQPVA